MEIEVVKELANIVTKHKIKDISILSNNGSSKTEILYSYLTDNTLDDQTYLEEKLGYTTNSSSFKKLLNRLKKKLFNTIFFIDLNKPSYSDYQTAYYEAYKEWAAIKILLGKGAKKTAVEYANNLYHKATKFELTEVRLNCAIILKDYYSIISLNNNKHNQYKIIIKEALKQLEYEIYTEDLFQQLRLKQIKQHEFDNSYETFFKKNICKINKIISDKNFPLSYKFYYYYYLFLFNVYDADSKLTKASKTANEAYSYIKSLTFNNTSAEYLFLKNQIITLLRLCSYNKLNDLFINAEELLVKESLNYFYHNLLYIIYCLRVGDYKVGTLTYNKIYNSKSYSNLPKSYKEYYNILAAYLSIADESFYIITGKIFKPAKFINNVPQFSKDKENSNITILIAHFILLIKEKKYSQAIDRVDALKQYSYRYLRKNTSYRSNCFIKILIEITKADFNRIRSDRYSEKYLAKLNNIKQSESKQTIDVEYINYNILYKLIQLNLK